MKSDKIFLISIAVGLLSFFIWLYQWNAQQMREIDDTFAKIEQHIQIENNKRIKTEHEFSIVPKIVYNKQHCPKKPIEGSDRHKVGKFRRSRPLEYSTEEFRIFAAVVGTTDSIRFNVSKVLFDKLQVGNAIDTITGYHFILL